jgi:hypothetical protein
MCFGSFILFWVVLILMERRSKGDLSMRIIVFNDGNLVFQGSASQFLKDNEGDEDVEDMIYEAAKHGDAERIFFSGHWSVYKVAEVAS